MAPPQGAAGVGAFLVVHRKRFVKRVEMDFLLWNPTQRNDSRGKAVNRRGRVGCETKRAFDVCIGHVHEDGLRHVVEVVPQRDDIGTDLRGKMVDALPAEHTAIRTGHPRCIVVFGHHHGQPLHHFVHFNERQFGVGHHVVFNAQSLTQRSGAGNRRRTVALNSLVDGPSHNGDISALTEQIDDSVQQNGRILAS